LIDRTKYVDRQIHADENDEVLYHLRRAIEALERRAARERGDEDQLARILMNESCHIEDEITCETCGHVACTRHE
jgi:hypothetical protein